MSAPLLILYIIHVFVTCKGDKDIKTGWLAFLISSAKFHYLLILDSVLVIGGGSFIGYHVSLRLAKTAKVIALDNFTDRHLIKIQRARLMNVKGD